MIEYESDQESDLLLIRDALFG